MDESMSAFKPMLLGEIIVCLKTVMAAAFGQLV